MSDSVELLFRIGEIIELAIDRRSGDELSLRTTVYQIVGDKKFSVAAPLFQGKLYPVEIGKHVAVYYHIKDTGVFSFNALVVSRNHEDNLPAIQLLRTSEINKSQRRMFYRVAFFGTIEMHVAEEAEPLTEVEKRRLELLKQKYASNPNIVIDEPNYTVIKLEGRDLSGGGFRFITTKTLKEGQVINGSFEIEGQKIDYQAQIMRIQKNELPYTHYEVGCMFLEFPEVQRAKIINYVFKKQRSHLNQKKE